MKGGPFVLVRGNTRIPIDRALTVIGRDEGCDVRLEGQLVSGRHALIVVGDGTARVLDYKSQNGVKVNDQVVTDQELGDGDRIEIGEDTFVFRRDGGAPRAARPDSAPKNPGEPSAARTARTARSGALGREAAQWHALGLGVIALHDAPRRADLYDRCARLILASVPAATWASVVVVGSTGREHESSVFLERRGGGVAAGRPDAVHLAVSAAAAARHAGAGQYFADPLVDGRLVHGHAIVMTNVRSMLAVPLAQLDESYASLVAWSRLTDSAALDEASVARVAVIAAHADHRLLQLGA